MPAKWLKNQRKEMQYFYRLDASPCRLSSSLFRTPHPDDKTDLDDPCLALVLLLNSRKSENYCHIQRACFDSHSTVILAECWSRNLDKPEAGVFGNFRFLAQGSACNLGLAGHYE